MTTQDLLKTFGKAIVDAMQEQNARSKLVDVKEGAKIAHVHPATLKRWIREGKIKNYSKGKKYLVNVNDLAN